MCLNASLAGLVAITAPCDVTDCFGAIIIGTVAGLLVIFGVWLLDYKLHIDDPVGAVAVHCLNGIWGTIAVGLFATDTAPAFSRGFGDGVSFGANQIAGTGLFYGGGFKLLGIQLLGLLSVAAWTLVTITLTFIIIKALVGSRVSEEGELQGLDPVEHGLASAYSGFSILDVSNTDDDGYQPEYKPWRFRLRNGLRSTEERSYQRRKTDLRCRYRHTQGCHYYQAFQI